MCRWYTAPIAVTVPGWYGRASRCRNWRESLSLHAKLILVGEEEALLGSFNLDPRSLLLNTELVLHLACPALCAELQQWLATWQQRSSHSVVAPPSTLRRLLARVSDWLPLQLVVSGPSVCEISQSLVRLRG